MEGMILENDNIVPLLIAILFILDVADSTL